MTKCTSPSLFFQGKRNRKIMLDFGGAISGDGGLFLPNVLRTWRNGEPDQGAAAWPVCRADQLPRLRRQPVPPAAVGLCLHPDGTLPRAASQGHEVRPGDLRDDQAELHPRRRGRVLQHAAALLLAVLVVPCAGPVPRRRTQDIPSVLSRAMARPPLDPLGEKEAVCPEA